jgi:hypothetical protein
VGVANTGESAALLDALRELRRGDARFDGHLRAMIQAARTNGAMWQEIADAMDVPLHSAREIFTRDARAALSRSVAMNNDLTEIEAMDIAIEEVAASRRARKR